MDFDSDGDWDILLGESSYYDLRLLEQLSDGSLARVTKSGHPFPGRELIYRLKRGFTERTCLAYGDVDGDGVADVVLADAYGRMTLLHRRPKWEGGLGKQQFGLANPFSEIQVRPGGFLGCAVPAVIDWNNDGRLDLLVSSAGVVRLFLAKDDGLFEEPQEPASPGNATSHDALAFLLWLEITGLSNGLSMAAVDWNADGEDDLVIFHREALYLLESSGATFLPASKLFTFPWPKMRGLPRAGTVADWDRDGRLDVIVGLTSGFLIYIRQDASGSLHLVPEDGDLA